MEFNEKKEKGFKGWLEIFKVYDDGREELFFSDHNVVVEGMGWTLARMFSADEGSLLEDFQITLFQLGTGAQSPINESLTNLAAPLASGPTAGYGANPGVEVVTQDLWTGSSGASSAFGVIPIQYVKKVDDRRVSWQVVIDETTANGNTVTEIGIYSKNPLLTTPTASAVMCAYRTYDAIAKASHFLLVFRWTIEF